MPLFMSVLLLQVMDSAKKAMDEIIPLFNEDELLIYDLDLTIKTENFNSDTKEGFIIKGARNTNGDGKIVWSNYNIDSKEDSE